jgi:hypothetical protein
MSGRGGQRAGVPSGVPLRPAKTCFSEPVARAGLVETVTVPTEHDRPAGAAVHGSLA